MADSGICGECNKQSEMRYHAYGQPASGMMPPICFACCAKVEEEVQARRERKGLNPDGTKKL